MRDDTDKSTENLVHLFCQLVRIGSESGEETELLTFLRDVFEDQLSATCAFDDFGNLFVRLPSLNARCEAPLLLCAHADTVTPGTNVQPVIQDGVIRSSGNTILGADNKAGIAQILEALRTAERRPPLEILITRCEEVGLLGVKNVDPSLITAKRGYVIDYADLDAVVIGGASHISLDITIHGKSGHAADPEDGISAISAAAEAIYKMPKGRIDPVTSTNVGIISGGTARNSIPDEVKIEAETRSLDHSSCLKASEGIRRVVMEVASRWGVTVDFETTVDFKASSISQESGVVRIAASAIRALGMRPRIISTQGGNDALILQGSGVSAAVLGYGGKNAHSITEHIAIKDLVMGARILRAVVEASADESECP